jgi:hypothetical protein
MKSFRLYGGTKRGYLAEGVITSYGIVMMQWFGPHGGVSVYNNKEDMLADNRYSAMVFVESGEEEGAEGSGDEEDG